MPTAKEVCLICWRWRAKAGAARGAGRELADLLLDWLTIARCDAPARHRAVRMTVREASDEPRQAGGAAGRTRRSAAASGQRILSLLARAVRREILTRNALSEAATRSRTNGANADAAALVETARNAGAAEFAEKAAPRSYRAAHAQRILPTARRSAGGSVQGRATGPLVLLGAGAVENHGEGDAVKG